MIPHPPRHTPTYTLFPSTTLFRSAEFEIDASKPPRAEGHDTGHHHAAKPAAKAADAAEATAESKPEAASESSPEDNGDAGTAVGAMESSDRVHTDRKSTRLNSSH